MVGGFWGCHKTWEKYNFGEEASKSAASGRFFIPFSDKGAWKKGGQNHKATTGIKKFMATFNGFEWNKNLCWCDIIFCLIGHLSIFGIFSICYIHTVLNVNFLSKNCFVKKMPFLEWVRWKKLWLGIQFLWVMWSELRIM